MSKLKSKLKSLYKNYIFKAKTPLFFLINWLAVMLILCAYIPLLALWLLVVIAVFWNPQERFWDLRIYFKSNGFDSIDMEQLKKKHIECPYILATLIMLTIVMGSFISDVIINIIDSIFWSPHDF